MSHSSHHFGEVLEGLMRVGPEEGPSRVRRLHEAISGSVDAGMSLHTLVTHAFPYGLIHEVVRQHHGKDPGFTLVTLGAVNHAVMMLHGGLLRHIVTTYCGDVYPAPGPNPNFNQAYLGEKVTIENWSVLSFCCRLMAGAMNLPGMPCRSLRDSTMTRDNVDSYGTVTDPFTGEPEGVVKALNPDLCLVHGWVADPSGNTLFCPPLSENLWGALAAKQGVVVSVEKIVDTDFIRANSHLAFLPAQFVRAVVELPFGAHPGGFFGRPLPSCSSYAEDYDFIVDFRNANREKDLFNDWMRTWVLDCDDHESYLRKLGPSHLADLVQKGRPDAWEEEFATLSSGISPESASLPSESMTVETARRIVRRVKEKNHRSILAGQGTSNLAAWLAAYLLKREQVEVDLVAETGFFGYLPRPGNPFLFNFANIPRCKMLTDSLTSLGGLVGGANARCIGSLSAGQVDRHGNVNSTLVPGVMYIVGSGGACDVLNTAEEVVVSLPLTPLRFVEKVPYVTGPGRRVTTVVNDRCVFEKPEGEGELVMVSLMHREGKTREELVRDVRGLLGWDPRVAPDLDWVEPPSPEELAAIRMFDPRRAFLKPAKE